MKTGDRVRAVYRGVSCDMDFDTTVAEVRGGRITVFTDDGKCVTLSPSSIIQLER